MRSIYDARTVIGREGMHVKALRQVKAPRHVKAPQALLLALAVMVVTAAPASAETINDPLGKVKVAHPWYGWAGYLFAVMAIFTLVVRTDREPASLAPSARAAVQALDPNLPIYDVRTMEDRIAGSFAYRRGR